MSLLGDRSVVVRAAFLALLALVLLGAEIPEVHDHAGATPGLYNEDCPLGRLATPSWGVAAEASDPLPQPDPACEPATPSIPLEPSAAVAPAFAARAPPVTS
jgi:hypothetical protein